MCVLSDAPVPALALKGPASWSWESSSPSSPPLQGGETSLTRRGTPTLTLSTAAGADASTGAGAGGGAEGGRTGDWVERVLVRLNMCPFTGSRRRAAVKLDEYGIKPAPVLYGETTATTFAELVRDFYGIVSEFVAGGDKK